MHLHHHTHDKQEVAPPTVSGDGAWTLATRTRSLATAKQLALSKPRKEQRAARLNSSQHRTSSSVSHLQLAKERGLEISVDVSTLVSASIGRTMRCL